MDSDLIDFFDEEVSLSQNESSSMQWNILVVDDDIEIHEVTKLVLQNFIFEQKPINIVQAYSRKEAEDLLRGDTQFAVAFIDVVMEEDNAGLRLVEFIRKELGNSDIRLVLRTGQPGSAPQSKVIVEYDINDYKEKTEFSSITLITTLTTSLRSYKYIRQIADMNVTLEKRVEERTKDLFTSLKLLEADLEAGRRIQHKLLPVEHKNIEGYDFFGKVIPSRFLSGDFIDYFKIGPNHIIFYVADVSGHGLSSSFVTVLLKSFISGYCERFRSQGDTTLINPAELLRCLNTEMLQEKFNKHLTLFYGVISIETSTLTYTTGAQYPYPIFFNGSETTLIKESGMAVGLFPQAQYVNKTVTLPPAFVLTIFSDGMLDLLPEKEIMDKEVHLQKIATGFGIDIQSILDTVGISEESELPDDTTVLIVKRL